MSTARGALTSRTCSSPPAASVLPAASRATHPERKSAARTRPSVSTTCSASLPASDRPAPEADHYRGACDGEGTRLGSSGRRYLAEPLKESGSDLRPEA